LHERSGKESGAKRGSRTKAPLLAARRGARSAVLREEDPSVLRKDSRGTLMDSHTQERTAPVTPPISASAARVRPSSSKMLTTYLADIEQMLDEQSWDAAVRDSVDLPSIAVALSDPELRSSGEGIRKWLADWVRPVQSDSSELDYERVSKMLSERATSGDGETRVPAQALRRLRLRRL